MWQQLEFIVNGNLAETCGNFLAAIGAVAVSYHLNDDIYEPKLNEIVLSEKTKVTALFSSTINLKPIINTLKSFIGKNEIQQLEINTVEQEDWQALHQKQFKPKKFAKKLIVYPSWQPIQTQKDEVAIELDPGLAFGTGSHPTTALCLEWLADHLKPGTTLIDYGCGSGILAIAALKLGARQVWAVDIDPQALTATKENAKKNYINLDQLIITQPEKLVNIEAHNLIANILANPLIELASVFENLLKTDGNLILSGIMKDQVPDVLSAYANSFKFDRPIYQDEWCLLKGKKSW